MTVTAAPDLDHFASRGFLRFPGALDPALTARWRDAALPRLRDAPEQIKDTVPTGPVGALGTLDPGDPRTWRWRRATLRGVDRARLEDVAPAVHAALNHLVAPGRLATSHITDYLIVSFPQRGLRRWLLARRPRRGAWHLDDPAERMTLRGWSNAALLVILFTDLAPGGGGPLLACDSPPRVAAALDGGPVDFAARARSRQIVSECRDFVEVTGRAGDVFLLHPFVLHSPAPNRSRVARILANPMLRVVDPLDFRGGPSPLERITAGWLR